MTVLNQSLCQQLKNNPGREIVKDLTYDRWFTARDIQQDVDAFAGQLTSAKLGRGDTLLLCLPNLAVFLPLQQAAWQLGIAVHPIAPDTPLPELLADQAQHHYAAMVLQPALAAQLTVAAYPVTPLDLVLAKDLRFVVVDAAVANRLAAPSGPVQEDDLALIMHTSGTTGKPKRVGLTHRIIVNAARHDAESNTMTADTIALITMPMFHINSQVMVTQAIRYARGKLVIAPKFSASRYWQWVADNQVDWTAVVPTIISFLLLNKNSLAAYDARQDEIHLRFVRSSSFALPEERLREFQTRFHTTIIEGYGLTEASSQCTINPFDAPKIGSAGKAYGTDVAIRTDNGVLTCEPNVTGEIAIRGDHVIQDYLDPHPDSFTDGWFLTGDLGYFDVDQYLFVRGRSKEIISRGGEKVAPAAVESVLSELDFIAQIAVIGMPDPLYGEEVTAVVVTTHPGEQEAADKQTILEYGRARLAKFEAPTRVAFVREFPRNHTGKVLRPALRDQLLAVGATK